jgi:hypothetical protein
MDRSAGDAIRFIAGAVAVFAAVYAFSERMDPVNQALRARVELLETRGDVVEAIAVGNSHGGTIEFEEMGMDGILFTGAGQDAFEGTFISRYALSQAPRLQVVLFTAPYGLTGKDHSVVGSADLRARRRHMYARIPLHGYLPGDRTNWIGGLVAPVVRDDHWSGVVREIVQPLPPTRVADDGRVVTPIPLQPPDADSLARYGPRIVAEHTRVGREMLSIDPSIPERVAAALDLLARDLASRNVPLVFFTPPYHESYLGGQNAEVNAEARSTLERLVAEHPNALWFDYSDDPRFIGKAELFNNSDHLNTAGGRLFSRMLRECLRATLEGEMAKGVESCPR